jgi:3-phosphoshikimate 1-carboxyvinyltransferase
MSLIIKKTLMLQGTVVPPSSKSESIRAVMMATLAQGESVLSNVLQAEDTDDAINICRELGASIVRPDENTLIIKSDGFPFKLKNAVINSGNSGITTHFVMPLLGLRENPEQLLILDCGKQMQTRPIQSLVSALSHLGLQIKYLHHKDTLPISISGELLGGVTEVDGITSQYLSALLFALPLAKNDSIIIVKNLQERPYVDITLNYLKDQNILLTHSKSDDVDIYKIKGRQKYTPIKKVIPSDFSSASYLIAASVLMRGEVILQGLNLDDAQGDKQLISILKEMGADITIHPTHLHVFGGKKLSGTKIDAKEIPDLLPTLAILGTYALGKTEIYNAAHARIKETDRIHSMTEGLTSLGAKIIEKKDGLTVFQSQLHGNHVKGHGDHRTVMALSIAGMMADGTTIIDDHEAINKTFPSFINTMKSIGANMEVAI